MSDNKKKVQVAVTEKIKKKYMNIGNLLDPTPSISVARSYKSVLGKTETNGKKKVAPPKIHLNVHNVSPQFQKLLPDK